jgi:hypothetical protein
MIVWNLSNASITPDLCVNNIHMIACYIEMEVKRLASKVKPFALHKLS